MNNQIIVPNVYNSSPDEFFDGSAYIPREIGNLKLLRKECRNQIVYYDWNLSFKDKTFASRPDNFGKDEIQIIFNINQKIDWQVDSAHETVNMLPGEVCVFRNNNYATAMTYEASANFVFKNLQMPTPYFQELLSKYFTDENITKLKEHFLTHVTKTTITPEMYRVLSEIDTADRFKEYEGVYTEGKMIELTALVLYGIVYHKTDEIKRLPQPNKKDVERVESLREKIQRNPALEYDAQSIADELGMSISKLNRVFRAMYATSLHSYVQDKRLEYAAHLLQENDIQISEAAQLSGYTNMSHFSKSFVKKYGVLPKDY